MTATTALPPSLAVEIAWGLSNQFSNDAKAQNRGESARVNLDRIVQSVNTSSNEEEKRYVNGTASLIDGALRTVHIIVRGRDLNIDDLDKLRISQQQHIEASARLTGNLESIAPRAVATLFAGGAGGAGLFESLSRLGVMDKTDLALVQGAAIAAAAALGYGINEFFVAPWIKRKLIQELIKKDYDRTFYFDQYYWQCQLALSSLCERVNIWHQAVFGAPFPNTEAKEVAKRVLEGSQSRRCPWVHKHVRKGWITPDLWALCETGEINCQVVKAECPVYKEREGHWPPSPQAGGTPGGGG